MLTASDRYKRQATSESPPAVALEVNAYKQFYGPILSTSTGSDVDVDGNAEDFFSAGDTVIVTTRLISAEFTISAVSYATGTTTITLSGFTYASDDYDGYLAKKYVLTEHLTKNTIGKISKRVETQTLNQFSSGQFKITLENEDQSLFDEAERTGIFMMEAYAGTATSNPTATVLTDTNANFPTITGAWLEIMSGIGAGRRYRIHSATDTTITIYGDDMTADNVKSGDQYQVSLDTVVYVTVKIGWKGLTDADERPIVIGGTTDNRSIRYDRMGKKLSLQVFGYIKRLDYLGAYEVSNDYGILPYMTGVTLIAYDEPPHVPVRYGPRTLEYRYPDGEALNGIDLVTLGELDTVARPRLFRFKRTDRFSWDLGDWNKIDHTDDLNSDGEATLHSHVWDIYPFGNLGFAGFFDEGYDATFKFGTSNELAHYPNHYAEDLIHILYDDITGERSTKKGKPTLQFDGGVKRQAITNFQAVLRNEFAGGWSDHTGEAITEYGTAFDILQTGDALYIGSIDTFAGVFFKFETPASQSFTNFKVYYSKGFDNWIEFGTMTDGSNGFTQDGWIQWSIPTDWRKAVVIREDTDDAYDGYFWVKIETDSAIPLDYLTKFGTTGAGDENLDSPRGIAADADYIYVADSNNNRITIWTNTATPEYVSQFGSSGSGNGEFNVPWGICVDDTYIYVSDSSNRRVQKFLKASPYTFQLVIGLGALDVCHGMDCDPGVYDAEDYLYIAGNNDLKVWVYKKDGTHVDSFEPFTDLAYKRPEDVAISEDGLYLYVVNEGSNPAYPSSHVVRKVSWIYDIWICGFATSTIWTWGVYAGSPDPSAGEWQYPHAVAMNGEYLLVSWGAVASPSGGFVCLKDNGATVAYQDGINDGGTGDGEFQYPYVGWWGYGRAYVADCANDRIQVFGWTPATCYQMRRLIGLIGKDEDQLTVDVDYALLPADGVREIVAIKHDDSGNPLPATWYELITAQKLAELLLDQAGYPSGVRQIDEMKLEMESPMVFLYGTAPYSNAPHPVTAMDYDASTGTLYMGMGLEIWSVTDTGNFERIVKVPDPGNGWGNQYQIIALNHLTLADAGTTEIWGVAVHPYGVRYHRQYGCPGIKFRYRFDTGEIDIFDQECGNGDTREDLPARRGLFWGTHVFRDSRRVEEHSNSSWSAVRRIGQYTFVHDPLPVLAGPGDKEFGENIAIPFEQIIASYYFSDYENPYYRINLGVQPASGIVTMDVDPVPLYWFAPRLEPNPNPRGRPFYWASPGYYSVCNYRPPFDDAVMLRYSFGQEGFLEFMDYSDNPRGDDDLLRYGFFHFYQSGTGAPHFRLSRELPDLLTEDCYRRYIMEVALQYAAGYYREQPMCGATNHDDQHIAYATINLVDMKSGGDSMGIVRIRDWGRFYFHENPSAIGLDSKQHEAHCRFFDATEPDWSDQSENVSTWRAPDAADFSINEAGDHLYLGCKTPFDSIHINLKASNLNSTFVVQYFAGLGAPNEWVDLYVDFNSSSLNVLGHQDIFWQLPIDVGTPSWEPWVAENWDDLTDMPAGWSAMANTGELYWIRIKPLVYTSGSADFGSIIGRDRVLWDGWDDEVMTGNGRTVLGMAINPTEALDEYPVIHGCYWNRDDGAVTLCDDPFQYKWFVLDTKTLVMYTTDILTDGTDCSNGQFKGFVYDSYSDAVYAVYTNPSYKDSGSILVKGTYDYTTNTISLERVGTIPAPDWGISGKLIATGDGRIYGVTHPQGILWHFDTTNYPRLTVANFGATMSIRQALIHLCQISNCTIRITPENKAIIERRDNPVAASAIETYEVKAIAKILSFEPWPHRYDGVRVSYTTINGQVGTEEFGQTSWEKKVLSISNPFIQDQNLARALAMTYAYFYARSRRQMKIATDFMPWLELRDVLKFAIPEGFLDIAMTQGWWLNSIEIDTRGNKVTLNAIEWFGEET